MFKKIFCTVLFITAIFTGAGNIFAQEKNKVEVALFTSPYCVHCQHLKNEFLADFMKRHKGEIILRHFDTTTLDGSLIFDETAKAYKQSDMGVPAMFIGNSVVIGYPEDIKNKADAAVKKAIENNEKTIIVGEKKAKSYKNIPDYMRYSPQTEQSSNGVSLSAGANTVDKIEPPSETINQNTSGPNTSDSDYEGVLAASVGEGSLSIEEQTSRFKKITLWAIISAGLVDGINPCAFAVIVFFVSFLTVYKYNRKEIIAVGSAYCFAVFLTYLLMGLGLFKFIYEFQGFYLVMLSFKWITIGLCFIFFLLTLYDFIIYQITKNSDKVILQLSKGNKEFIHKITRYFMRDKEKSFFMLILAAFVAGFVISLVEAACTGQVYLPTIALILKDTGNGYFLKAVEYLVLYNVMFILPLIAVLVLTLIGYEAKSFNAFLKKYLGLTKFLLCMVFLLLLVLLIRGM